MKKKIFPWITFLVLTLSFIFTGNGEAQKRLDLIGRETPYFTLPSTEDRTISYKEEYYGKHHLIITFFPAAFTPI